VGARLGELQELWPQLTPTAQQALVRLSKILAGRRYSGIIELRCYQGGIRLVRINSEWRPGDKEYAAEDGIEE